MSFNKEQIAEFTEEYLDGGNENDDFPLSDRQVVRAWVRFLSKKGLNPSQNNELLYTPQDVKNKKELENADKYSLIWKPTVLYQKETEAIISVYIGIGENRSEGDANIRLRNFEIIK